MPDGKAMRYGRRRRPPRLDWAGAQTITRKQEWPTWTPPAQMLKRRPDLPRFMPGGPEKTRWAPARSISARPSTASTARTSRRRSARVSSGCIRHMLNEDVIDLYERVKVGTRVVVAR